MSKWLTEVSVRVSIQAFSAAFAVWFVMWPTSVSAQDEPSGPAGDAHYRAGAISYTPAVVFSTGYDSNVYREAVGFADYETFVVPQIEAWWTQPGFVVTGIAAVEVVNFKNHLGGTNHQFGARIDRTNSIVAPYFSWTNRHTNAGPTGFEAGYKSMRLEDSYSGGVRTLLSPRLRMQGFGRLVKTNWDADARYQTSSLRETLNRDTLGAGANFSYAITSLTGVGFFADFIRDHFVYSPLRDGDTWRFGPTVDFAPAAVVFGTVTAGYQLFRAKYAELADFATPFLAVNVGYGVPEGTLIKVGFGREATHSADITKGHYVLTSFGATASRRVATRWDLAGFAGRYNIAYQDRLLLPLPTGPANATTEYGGAGAYRVGRWTRIGVSAERAVKTGGDAYEAFRVVGFVTYGSGRFQRLDRPIPFER